MRVELAIIEVGLGGKLDATNVLTPIVVCITNVSLDHLNILGNTIEAIAKDKSQIIKQGISIVTAAKGKALRFVEERAKQMGSKIIEVGKAVRWERIKRSLKDQEFLVKTPSEDYQLHTYLLGRYQGDNMACAIAILEELRGAGFNLSKAAIIKGIEEVFLPARSEVISRKPLIILDSAHNETAIQAIKELILQDLNFEDLVLVLGIFKDKRVKQMVKLIAPLARKIIVTQSKNLRSLKATKLLEIVKRHTKASTYLKPSSMDAFNLARELANPQDLVLVCGSLALAGEIRRGIMQDYFEISEKQLQSLSKLNPKKN